MNCHRCETEIKFCPHCGHQLVTLNKEELKKELERLRNAMEQVQSELDAPEVVMCYATDPPDCYSVAAPEIAIGDNPSADDNPWEVVGGKDDPPAPWETNGINDW
jgi:hypothetical protein